MAFHLYVEQYILKPTGMHNSGFLLNDKIKQNIATGYHFKKGVMQKRPYTWVHRYPPTSMLTTANDMAKFVRMFTVRSRRRRLA